MIVLDASGSMWGQIEGRSKIEIARETLAKVTGDIPAGRVVGLMAYGHRSRGDCADIELVVPPGSETGAAISDAANRLQPKGKTPLSAAVRQAAEALRFTEEKATVILVTDGLETCEADPCALAAQLEATGVDFTAHVVGFGLTRDEGAQVACLAENTGGRYIEAADAQALDDALSETVVAAAPEPEPAPEPAPVPVPVDNLTVTMALCESCDDLTDEITPRWDIYAGAADGPLEKVDGGYDSALRRNLPAGDYVLEAEANRMERRIPFTIAESGVTELHIDWNAGYLVVVPVGSEADLTPIEGARVDLRNGGWQDGTYGKFDRVVPAGSVRIEVSEGKARAEDVVTVVAGERVERNVILGTGTMTVKVYYAPGGPLVEDGDMRYDFRPAGGGEPVAGGYGHVMSPLVPAGEYVAEIRLGKVSAVSAPVRVAAGGTAEAEAVLNAGVLAISAPGAKQIEILAAKMKINGDRDGFGSAYGETAQQTLPAGEYLIRVSYETGEKKEGTAVVTAGERTEFNPN